MPEKDKLVPVVPAQEAPREEQCMWCKCGLPEGIIATCFESPSGLCERGELTTAEPQVGAQVPSQDALRETLKRREAILDKFSENNDRLLKHLNTIKCYATEAAKTPITREDMHDHLKAQTFFDEAKGFERLVLSEIGGGK